MKPLAIAFIFLTSFVYAQKNESTPVEYTLIDSVQGSQTQLYIYARSWLASAFKSSKSVIEMEDKESGIIIGNGVLVHRVNSVLGNQVGIDVIRFTITINVKTDKYRAILSNFSHSYIQQASTYIEGQELASSVGRAASQSRNGGSLDSIKPDCGNFMLPKNQWMEIKEFTKTKSDELLKEFQKAMREGKSKSEF